MNMPDATSKLEEVVVRSERSDRNVNSTDIGMFRLDPKSIESVPVLFGEKDILKVLQMTPGVKAAGEGNAGFYVRGGSADQNLVVLDEAPVYNASHMLGFFSVFNSDAVKDATIYKGGIPAQYGGRSASVLDVKMRDGNQKKFSASGGIGTISSRLTLEGPIVKDKGAFMISARRTYADLYLLFSKKESMRKSKLYFYDLNLKANYKITEKDRIFLSGYFGRDVFGLDKIFGTDWGNATGTLRWNHIMNPKTFTNTSVIFSNYSNALQFGRAGDGGLKASSQIRDWNIKHDISITQNANNSFKIGANVIQHSFIPGKISMDIEGADATESLAGRKSYEGAVYAQHDLKIGNKFAMLYGLRYSGYGTYAKDKVYTFDKNGTATAEDNYKNWKNISYYGGLEPRMALKYSLGNSSSVKASYNRMYQYLHQLSNSTTTSPFDQWVSTSNNVKPQIADQASFGYFRNFHNDMYELSAEVYYKNMQNQIDYRPGAALVFNEAVEGELVYGKGMAYGAEFLLRKQTGKLTGWVSYTLSRTMRKFDDIGNGRLYPAKQDRLHDLAIVGMYQLTPKLQVSANWIYYTGNAVTFPSGMYTINGLPVPYYTERNGYRMKDYHRLDIGVTWYRKRTETRESSWNFSLYNAYGRENPYMITFQQNEEDPTKTEAVQTTLFRWVPSITYNFKF